jgi:tetratricopeptide (TPR) repeat protein
MIDRLQAARAYVEKRPTDKFGLYALAMELRRIEDWDACFAAFATLLGHYPDYGAAYYHLGAARKESGDRPGALATLREGMGACQRSGDSKTRGEIESLIDTIEDEDA